MKIGTFNLFAGSSLLALASVASAQTAPAAGELEEVFVTARRVEEKLQDVPISITVFNQEQLDKANVVNATDLAAITPSLSANNNFGSENASFAMRGFVQDPGTPPSVGVYFADVVAPRAANNGVQVGDGAGPGAFFDLQNVQVLKGPQGTLFGRNTTGGAILFVPKKPTDNFEGFAEVSAGNYHMQRGQGAINIPLGDRMRFRFAADYQNRDGYAMNNVEFIKDAKTDFYDVNYYALRASLVVDVTPSLETYLIGSFGKSHTNGTIAKLVACDQHPISLGLTYGCTQLARNNARGDDFYTLQSTMNSPQSMLKTAQIIDTTTWHASDTFTLKNIISYAELSDILRTAQFGTDFRQNGDPKAKPIPLAFIQPPPGLKTAHQSTFTEELQAQGSALEEHLTFQGGLYFESSRPLSKTGNQSPFLLVCKDSDTFQCTDVLGSATDNPAGALNYTVGETDFRNIGIYSQMSYAVTDKFKVEAGYRYTWDRQRNTSTLITYVDPHPRPSAPGTVFGDNGYTGHVAGEPLMAHCSDAATDTNPTNLIPIPNPDYDPDNPVPGVTPIKGYFDPADGCVLKTEKRSSAPTWLIDFNYKATDDMMLYASYKRGYRAGGIIVGAPKDKRIFDPEKVNTYELGMKSEFRGAVSGRFNVTGFVNDFTNQQLQLPYIAATGSGYPHTYSVVNAGKSEIYGAEVEALIKPIEDLTLSVNYTYLKTNIRKVDDSRFVSSDPVYSSTPPVKPGNPLTLSPENKYTVSATYTLPLSDSIGKISVGATFIHTDTQISTYTYLNDTNTPPFAVRAGGDFGKLQARNLLNANVDWDSFMGLPVDLSLFGTNLTNQKYYNFVPGVIAAGFENATLSEPRMYGARLRYNF